MASSDRAMDFVGVVNDLRARMARLEALGAARWGAIGDTWHLVGSGGSEPGFQNSWTNFGSGIQSLRFRSERGRVYVEGMIKSGASSTVAFTLPVGYRPAAIEQRIIRVTNSADGAGVVNILTTGDVTPIALAGTGTITTAMIAFDFATD